MFFFYRITFNKFLLIFLNQTLTNLTPIFSTYLYKFHTRVSLIFYDRFFCLIVRCPYYVWLESSTYSSIFPLILQNPIIILKVYDDTLYSTHVSQEQKSHLISLFFHIHSDPLFLTCNHTFLNAFIFLAFFEFLNRLIFSTFFHSCHFWYIHIFSLLWEEEFWLRKTKISSFSWAYAVNSFNIALLIMLMKNLCR